MKVYEFWLKEESAQPFEELCESFYKIGEPIIRKADEGTMLDGIKGSAVHSISRNPNTHWVQLLVDDNTPQTTIIVIEARINGLMDDEPFRKYEDDMDNYAPIETPKHFMLERVLRVRQRQKDRTLGRIEDVE